MGPSTGVGNEYCSWVLKPNGANFARRTLRSLTHIEQSSAVELKKLQNFDYMITNKYGDGISGPKHFDIADTIQPLDFDDYENGSDKEELMTKESFDSSGQAINQQPIYDKLIDANVRLSHNDEIMRAKVRGRTVFDNRKTSGTYHKNLYDNTMIYDVTFSDGTVKEYAASLIAENMVDQVDKESFEYDLLDGILDHWRTRYALTCNDERLLLMMTRINISTRLMDGILSSCGMMETRSGSLSKNERTQIPSSSLNMFEHNVFMKSLLFNGGYRLCYSTVLRYEEPFNRHTILMRGMATPIGSKR